MNDLNLLAIDTSKRSFALHMNDCRGKNLFKKEVKRERLLEKIAQTPKCLIVMEACGGSHHWAREFVKLGHEVKLIAVQHVVPYRKSNKNDANDAAAIAEAAARPSMHFVSIKQVWQQDIQCLHRIRQRLIKNQTSLTNETRGLLAEYGVVVNEGIDNVRAILPEIVQGKLENLTFCIRKALGRMHEELLSTTESIEEIDAELMNFCKENELCRNLDEIEGIGHLTATALIAHCGDPHSYKNGRQFAASLGLVPGHTQTGGKKSAAVMGGITKRGNPYLRTLMVQGGMSLVRATKATITAQETARLKAAEKPLETKEIKVRGEGKAPVRKRNKCKSEQEKFHRSQARRDWLARIMNERGVQKAAVAMANKNARIVWVLLTKKVKYNPDMRFGGKAA